MSARIFIFGSLAASAACQFGPPSDVPPDGSIARPITVAVEVGTGGGRVTSSVGGIDCGAVCATSLDEGTEVTFTAGAPAGSSFVGWRGDAAACGAAATCTRSVGATALTVGARFAADHTAAWLAHIGGVDRELGVRVVSDGTGATFVAVTHWGPASFADLTFPHVAASELVLARLSPAGDLLWSRAIAGGGVQDAADLAVDPITGELIVFGSYGAATELGGPTPLSLPSGDTKDYFLARYAAATGALIWQRGIHVSDVDDTDPAGLAVAPNGDLLIAGGFNTSIELGPTPLTTGGDTQAFLARLAADDGQVVWQQRLGGFGSGLVVTDVATDRFGEVYLAGSFLGPCQLGGATMNPTGGSDAVVARLAAVDGRLIWQRPIGGRGADLASAVAVDVNGNVIVAVSYTVDAGVVDFAGQPVPGAGTGVEALIGSLTQINGFRWATRLGGSGADRAYALEILDDGTLAAAGAFTSPTLAIGDDTLTNGGLSDLYVARLAPDTGVPSWAAGGRGTGDDLMTSLASVRNLLVIGAQFQTQLAVGGAVVTSRGASDALVVAIPLAPP